MAVVKKPVHVLRGRIRAQTREAINVGNRIMRAYRENPDLKLFVGVTGPASLTDFQLVVDNWNVALALKN